MMNFSLQHNKPNYISHRWVSECGSFFIEERGNYFYCYCKHKYFSPNTPIKILFHKDRTFKHAIRECGLKQKHLEEEEHKEFLEKI